MVSATVRLVGAPDRTTGDDLGLMLPLIVTVVGITVLAACVIMIMIACLVRYRGKAKKHKIGKHITSVCMVLNTYWTPTLFSHHKDLVFVSHHSHVYCFTTFVGQSLLQLKSTPSVNRRN